MTSIFTSFYYFANLMLSHITATRKSIFRQTQAAWQTLQAWHIWVLFCAIESGVIFCLNLTLAIWASTIGIDHGIATIRQGKCNAIKSWALWLHLGSMFSAQYFLGQVTIQCNVFLLRSVKKLIRDTEKELFLTLEYLV